MKISRGQHIAFEDVFCGDMFFYEGNYYIKLANTVYDGAHEECNCVLLSSGEVNYIKTNEMVVSVNGEVKIY